MSIFKHPFRLILIAVAAIAILALLALGTVAWLLVPGKGITPDLSVPEDRSPAEQARILMGHHLVDSGRTPVKSFLLYAENGKTGLLVHEGVGTVGRSEDPVGRNWRFNCASVTKMFVSTVVLQLEEVGLISLDDPVSLYLGDGGYLRLGEIHQLDGMSHGEDITIAQLLRHRSGLGDIFLDTQTRFNLGVLLHPHRQYDARKIMDSYFRFGLGKKPHFAPGNGYYYSDINYVVLGTLIERMTGQSLPQAIRTRILEPVGMDDTWFAFHEPPHGTAKPVDQYYGRINMTRYINTSYEWGGGSHATTTKDLALFIKALFAGKLFREASTLRKMLDGAENAQEGQSYACGINKYEVDGRTYWGHGGFYGTLLLYDPVNKVTFSANISQAMPPFDPEAAVRKILEIIGVR